MDVRIWKDGNLEYEMLNIQVDEEIDILFKKICESLSSGNISNIDINGNDLNREVQYFDIKESNAFIDFRIIIWEKDGSGDVKYCIVDSLNKYLKVVKGINRLANKEDVVSYILNFKRIGRNFDFQIECLKS